MSVFRTAILSIVAVVAVAGCKAAPLKCSGSADYLKAESITPITAGGKLAESPSALKVPELTPAAREAAKEPIVASNKRAACLDYPPSLMVPNPITAAAPPGAPAAENAAPPPTSK